MVKRRKAGSSRTGPVKSKKRDVTKPDAQDLSDQVSILAAHLLEGDDYQEAARRAYPLLQACKEEVAFHSALQLGDELGSMAYGEAVAEITGHKDREYGRKQYREFCFRVLLPLWQATIEADLGPNSEVEEVDMTEEEFVERFLAVQRARGIPKILVAALKPLFRLTKPKRRATPRSKRKWLDVSHFAKID